MTSYCQDRDLLSIEPIVFMGGGFPGQQLTTGTAGQLTGATFSAAGADFSTATVQGGMVLCTYTTTPEEGSLYEIISVDSATTLSVSVLRANTDDAAIPPVDQSSLSFSIRTYSAQIASVCSALGEKLRQVSEVTAVAATDFADSTQLRQVAAQATLAAIFVARADNAQPTDANWIKAQHYRQLHRSMLLQLRLAVDADGDGLAEQTRSLGNVTLTRI